VVSIIFIREIVIKMNEPIKVQVSMTYIQTDYFKLFLEEVKEETFRTIYRAIHNEHLLSCMRLNAAAFKLIAIEFKRSLIFRYYAKDVTLTGNSCDVEVIVFLDFNYQFEEIQIYKITDKRELFIHII